MSIMPCPTPAKVASRPFCCAMVLQIINKAPSVLLTTLRQQTGSRCGMVAWAASLVPVLLLGVTPRPSQDFPKVWQWDCCYLPCSRRRLPGGNGYQEGSQDQCHCHEQLEVCSLLSVQWGGSVAILLDNPFPRAQQGREGRPESMGTGSAGTALATTAVS